MGVRSRLAAAVAVLAGALGLAAPASAQGRPAAELKWADIHWEAGKIGGRTVEKAALLIPVRLDGVTAKVLVQLDLGADLTQFEAVPYEQLFGKGTVPRGGPKKMPFTGTFGGVRVANRMFDVLEGGERSSGDDPVMLGTLGADFFQKRILTIDFIGQRVSILGEGEGLPEAMEKRASWVPLTVREGKLHVPLSVNGKEEDGFFYDSGSSVFAIVATRSKWQEMTGRKGDEPDNEVWRVPSWGKEAVMVGARTKGDLKVGAARLERPLAFFESSGLENLGTANLFGNALFFDRFQVIVDIPGKRFGLMGK